MSTAAFAHQHSRLSEARLRGDGSSRVDTLTGMRAVAALAVCVNHAAFWAGGFTADWRGSAFARLEVAVPFFFVLSGFLLFRPWVTTARSAGPAQAGGPAPSVRRYLTHRAWRVLPAYWTVITVVYLIYTVRVDLNSSGRGYGGYLRHMLFIQVYGPGHVKDGLTQTWSMCVEVVFYLALPLFGWLLLRLCRTGFRVWRALGMLAVVGACSLGWVAFTCGTDVLNQTARVWPPTYAVCLAAGMALALVPAGRRIPTVAVWGCVATAAAIYALLLTRLVGPIDLARPTAVQGAAKLGLEAAFGAAVVAAAAFSSGRGVASRLLAVRPMVWLGDISYEYYMIHVMALDIVVRNIFHWHLFSGNTVAIVVVTSAITVPLSWALHRSVLWLRANMRRHTA
ncbi:acyltransferase family protein [Tsukamurella soli]|uniref:acyltransferase family protein n=1 Tax=Tsukamurella soli TaxID=644556 RepID=UPI0031E65F0A